MIRKIHSKILFVPNHSVFRRGDDLILESEELGIIRKLKAHGWSVGVCAFQDDSKNTSLSGSVSLKEVTFNRLNFLSPKCFAPVKLVNYIYSFISIPFFLAGHRFVYIFCPGHNSYAIALWCLILRIPFGLYVRGVWSTQVEYPSAWDRVFRKARFMIVTGKLFQRLLTRHCDRVENEVPLTSLRPSLVYEEPTSSRQEKDILYVGRLHVSKGILDLINAVGLLISRGLDVRLKIAGGGLQTEVDQISLLANSLGMSDRIIILGHVPQDQLLSVYKQTGIFAFPSYYAEGFPRVIYEAMMLGACIVTCEMPGTKEFVVDNKNCLIVPPKNPERLADTLSKLIVDQSLSNRLRHQAFEDVRSLFSEFIDSSHPDQLVRLIDEVSFDSSHD